jgi:hypothetical protein
MPPLGRPAMRRRALGTASLGPGKSKLARCLSPVFDTPVALVTIETLHTNAEGQFRIKQLLNVWTNGLRLVLGRRQCRSSTGGRIPRSNESPGVR